MGIIINYDSALHSGMFKKIGRDVTIWPLAKIVDTEVITIGNNVMIDDFVFIMGGKGIHIGSYIHISAFTSIVGGGELIMEDFSCLSGGVRLYTGNDNYSGEWLTNATIPLEYRNPVRSHVYIRKHAIIGANTVILPGVTIGEGAAIGANSLVTKDIEPWTINAGSPCRIIKKRPMERIMKLEQELKDRNLKG